MLMEETWLGISVFLFMLIGSQQFCIYKRRKEVRKLRYGY